MTLIQRYQPEQLTDGIVEWGERKVVTPALTLVGDNELQVALGEALVVGEFTVALLAGVQFRVTGVELVDSLQRCRRVEAVDDADLFSISHGFKISGVERIEQLEAFPSSWFFRCWVELQTSGTYTFSLRLNSLEGPTVATRWYARHYMEVNTIPTVEVTQ